MMRTIWFRTVTSALSVVLAAYAVSGIFAERMRPPFRIADFFRDETRPTITEDKWSAKVAFVSIDGGILSDYAALKSRQALATSPDNSASRAAANRQAQDAARWALTASPVNSSMWLILALLKTQMDEPTAASLKMSYFTGPVGQDALALRIRTLATTSAVVDEDIRLLAQTDIRTVLTRYPRLEPSLAATYRQAPPDGKKFLLDATQAADPKFSQLLRQYP